MDGDIEKVEKDVALLSPYVHREVNRHGRGYSRDSPVALPKQVSPAVLKLILEYCRFHRVSGRSDKVRSSASCFALTVPFIVRGSALYSLGRCPDLSRPCGRFCICLIFLIDLIAKHLFLFVTSPMSSLNSPLNRPLHGTARRNLDQRFTLLETYCSGRLPGRTLCLAINRLSPPHCLQERKIFDEKFIRLDTRVLCELTSAADSLDMKPLVDLTSRALARMIEGKTPEEIRETFHLPDDLTEVRRAYSV